MEINFERKQISCLNTVLEQVQCGEQTLEIRLPEGMPDVGQVITAWGQPVARSKEWQDETLQFSGGMMVWVLYQPEDGSGERCIEGWIPFQMRWEIPEGLQHQGGIHSVVQCNCVKQIGCRYQPCAKIADAADGSGQAPQPQL